MTCRKIQGTARKGPMDEIYPDFHDSTPNRTWTIHSEADANELKR